MAEKGQEQPKVVTTKVIDLAASAHPTACSIHMGMKAFVVFLYFYMSLFTSDSMFVFVLIIVSSAIDFWITKNITGRLLVGLRWWSEPGDNGLDTYVFECKVNENANNAMDSRIFWWTLSLASLYWLITAGACVMAMALTKTMVTGFCLLSNGINLWAFFKCSRIQSKEMQSFMKDLKARGVDYVMQQEDLQKSCKKALYA